MSQPKRAKLPLSYQWWKNSIRVRVWVPLECRAKIGKSELVKALDTTNPKIATDRGADFVAAYKGMIRDARPVKTSFATPLVARNLAWISGHPAAFAAQDPKMIDVTPSAEITADSGTSFDELIAAWKKDRKAKSQSSIKATENAFAKLRAYLGHGEGSRVTEDDMVDFKVSLTGAQNSQRQRIAMIKAVFGVAYRNRKIRPNPCRELETPPRDDDAGKEPFNRDDLQKAITAALADKRPLVKFGTLLATYQGVRREDFANALVSDVSVVDGMMVLTVDQGKTPASRRRFVLHGAIVDAGFAAYVSSRHPDSPLFDVSADKSGNRSDNAGGTLTRWLERIGIKREDETSWHSFRHSWKTVARHYIPNEAVADYLSGSANVSESRKYGIKGKHKGFPLATLKQNIDLIPSDIAEWPLD
jgi:integrase